MKLFTLRKDYPYKLMNPSKEVEILYRDVTVSDQKENNIKEYFINGLNHFEIHKSIRLDDLEEHADDPNNQDQAVY